MYDFPWHREHFIIPLSTVEDEIKKQGASHRQFRDSADITLQLFQKIKNRCGSTPMIVFSAFNDEPYFGQFKAIFDSLGIPFLTEIPALAWEAEDPGKPSKLISDGHWDLKGQRVCGAYLADYITEHFTPTRRRDA